MSSPLPAGAGRRCARCAERGVCSVTTWSTSGRGWCPACGDGGVPLVPATSSPRRFLKIQQEYRRLAREHDEGLDPYWQRPAPAASPRKKTGRPANRPPMIPDEFADEARRWARTPGWTEARLVERIVDRFGCHRRTARRFLKRHGIRLRRPTLPARRS